jgi:hypothetical protein
MHADLPSPVFLAGASLLSTLLACGGAPSDTLPPTSHPGTASDAGGLATSVDGGSPSAPVSVGDSGSVAAPGDATPGDAGVEGADGGAGGARSRKRGIAYGSNSDADLAALSAGIGWWYNWSASPDATLTKGAPTSGVEFVPMIWGGTFDPAKLATQVPAGAKYLLTFNEPNFNAQSNLTPQQAAALWPKVQAFADAHGLAIVSPALNYCGGGCNETNPFTWLDAFFAACTGCRVDYVAAHWYACTKSALQGYLAEYETKYDKPLWLTEFSCLDGSIAATAANETKYMTDALALLESDPKVFRYSWFTGRFSSQPAINLLGAASGALTPLGQTYVSLPEGP